MTRPYDEALAATLIDRTIRERIVLVAVAGPRDTDDDVEASLDELALLVDTAGADEVGRMVQRRDSPDHTWYIGKGKAEELKQLCLAVDADTVVFDNELAPAQQYNLEKLLGRTAIDRTAVILDIFGQNAHTLEGKAQVELALLRYRLPRLRRGSEARLSQQRGGVGARFGGGETKLETDRRRIMRRINKLEADLVQLAEHPIVAAQGPRQERTGVRGHRRLHERRQVDPAQPAHRFGRARREPAVRHARSDDAAARPARRRAGTPVRHGGVHQPAPARIGGELQGHARGRGAGRLPRPCRRRRAADPGAQMDAVREVLDEIDAATVPELLVFNKADLAPGVAKELVQEHPGSVSISAATGEGVDEFLRTLGDRLRLLSTVHEFSIPYDRGDVLAAVHREGEVVSIGEGDHVWTVRARLSDASAGRLESFLAAALPADVP